MTRFGNRDRQDRSFASQEVQLTQDEAVAALINGELDTDAIDEDQLNELMQLVPEEHIETLADNNPDLDIIGDDVDPTPVDLAAILEENSEEDVINAIASGELVITDENGEALSPEEGLEALLSDEDESDDDDDDTENDEERSFAGQDAVGNNIFIDAYGNMYDEDGDEIELVDADEIEEERSFAGFDGGFSGESAEDAYERGRQEAMADAEEAAQRVYSENRHSEQRAFALEQTLHDSDDVVSELVQNGQVRPADAPLLQAILYSSASIQGQTRSYAAAELGEMGEETLHDLLVGYLSNQPKNPMFDSINMAPSESDIRAFSAEDFEQMHQGGEISRQIDRSVRAIIEMAAEQGERVSYMEALSALQEASK